MIEYHVTKVEPFKDPEIVGDGFVYKLVLRADPEDVTLALNDTDRSIVLEPVGRDHGNKRRLRGR